MPAPGFLHDHPNFVDLLRQLAQQTGIATYLIEKDYWLMHGLWVLQQQGWQFQLKGGTSLSKGFGLISRFSEDIDITVFREDLGQAVDVEALEGLSGKKQRAHLNAIKEA